jgi:small subunit ribosomal protein S4
MISGPKYKICKRLGGAVFEKCQTQKFSLSEAKAGKRKLKHGGQPSDYKRQLIEKQKMRFSYGISEKQLSRYVEESMEHSKDPVAALVGRLETRLDNVVYRLGLAKTRRLARQLVSHGHILVNNKRLTIPSHQVRMNDVVSVREGSKTSPLFMNLVERTELASIPTWLRIDLAAISGQVISNPEYTQAGSIFDPDQVFEYYSR